uniref:Uncharacterized protein n=1 Tax=Arundo donax TaxID=35708 RepID=A0A0A9H4L6_ARUDO
MYLVAVKEDFDNNYSVILRKQMVWLE